MKSPPVRKKDAPSPAPAAASEDRRRDASPSESAGAELARQWRLTLKELRETLRDRRTIITLILMPVLVYPLLGMAFQRYLLSGATASLVESEGYRVGVESEDELRLLSDYVVEGNALLDFKTRRVEGVVTSQPSRENSADPRLAAPKEIPLPKWFVSEDLHQSIATGALDLGIRRRPDPGGDTRPSGAVTDLFELISLDRSPIGQDAFEYVRDRLQAKNEYEMRRRLFEKGVSPYGPAEVLFTKLESRQQSLHSALPTLAPLILILMTITGAVYPAIDLTAGERERNTLETLIAAPVSRMKILLAKYVAVMAVAIATATVNLVSMTATAAASGMGKVLFGDEGLSAGAAIHVFALMVLFAAFFAAVLLAVTSFARSFKEAQAYLIPLMMLALAPGMLSLTPDLKLAGPLAVTPLVNIVLLARDVLSGEATTAISLVVVVSTILYALAAIGLAARVFGADSVLYGGRGSWSDLWRAPAKPQSAASISGAFACLAVVFALHYILGNLAGLQAQQSLNAWLAASATVLALVFGGTPLVALLLGRVRVAPGLALTGARWPAWIAALLLGISLWPFAYEIYVTQDAAAGWLWPKVDDSGSLEAAADGKLDFARELLKRFETASPLAVLLCMAVAPGIFEELFFRGYLFTALANKQKAWLAIAGSATLFAGFHVVTGGFTDERFLPSLFIGLVLGYLRLRCGSVLPGMLAHACHNGLLLSVVMYRERIDLARWFATDQRHLPALWLAAAAVTAISALALATLARKRTAGMNLSAAPAT